MIPEVNPYNNYRGDGVATLFDYDFFIQNGSQLIVEHIDENDVVTRLEENIDYEIVVIEEEFAGYIKFPIEDSKFGILQENETLSLQLTLPFEQISEYGQSSLLDLNSIEFSYDYLTRLCQILKRQMERAIKVNEGSETNQTELLESINNNAIVSTNAAALASQKADEALESANVASGKIEELQSIYDNAKEDIEQSSTENIEELNKIKEEVENFKNELIKTGINKFSLFDTKISDHILEGNEAKGWALQGTWVSGALYPDFYNKCLEQKISGVESQVTLGESTLTVFVNSNGHQFYNISDKSIVDAFFETFGIADFYGVDEENERVFLPRNKYFQQLTDDVSKVNDRMEAGLPNITGTTVTASGYGTVNGAFERGNSFSGNGINAHANWPVSFDASRSSSIYGNSDTVQPPSSLKLLYYCVGNTVVNEGEIDVSKVLDEAVLKSSLEEVQVVVETYKNGHSWYRVWSDGWCEQGGYHENTSTCDTVYLVKPYINTDYTLIVSDYDTLSLGGGHATSPFGNAKTTTSFNIAQVQAGYEAQWRTCGYIK